MEWVNHILNYQLKHQYTDRQMAMRLRLSLRKYRLLHTNPTVLGTDLLRLQRIRLNSDHEANRLNDASNDLLAKIKELNELIPYHLYNEMSERIKGIERIIERLD